jgi:hypothetical protein
MMGTCHCRDCQRHSGSAFATLNIIRVAKALPEWR